MAFNWEIELTFDSTLTDRPAGLDLNLPLFKALHGNIIFRLVCSAHAHEEVDLRSRPAGLSVSVLSNVDIIK